MMPGVFGKKAALLLTAAGMATLDSPVQAQAVEASSPPQPASSATEAPNSSQNDIVVTANKREERVKDVALSISAISGAELERRQVQDIEDLARTVPGLSFIRSGSIAGNGNQIILRGLNTGSGGATVASTVDEAPLSFSVGGASFATDFEPWDLQRVEVLRGPQGSLYGASALGGLIKYVTNAPELSHFGGGLDVGGFDLRGGGAGASGKAYVNVPIVDGVAAIRISGYNQYSPGWIDNQLGRATDINGFRRYGGRATLLVKPSDRLTIRATALYQKLASDGFDSIEVAGLTDPADPFRPLHGYNLNTFLPQPSSSKAQLYIGNITYDVGGVGIQSITSYGKLDNYRTNDVPLYGQAFGGLLFGRPQTTLYYKINANLAKFNQEVRLFSQNNAASDGHGLQWQIGGFYTHESIDNLGDYFTKDQLSGGDVTTPLSPTTGLVLQGNQHQTYREFAGYVDFTYFFSPHFDIEAGGRVFNNKQRQSLVQGGALLGVPLGTTEPDTRSGETSGTFSVAPRYHFTRDVMIYARAASGYRPGGPQAYVPNAPANLPSQYAADRTINYEIGLKGSLIHNLVSFDVAAFYVDWTNVQITVSYPLGGVAYNVTGNAGHALSQGGEWSLGLNPMRGLSLSWIGAYTDAHLTRDAPGIGGFKGDKLPYVPQFSTTVSGSYEWSLGGDYKASVGGSWSHQSHEFSSYTLTPSLSHLPFPGYDSWAAELGVRKGPVGVLLYGKNLTDKRGITYYYAGQAALGGYIPAQTGLIRPREIGVRLTGNF